MHSPHNLRRIDLCIHQRPEWPNFTWPHERLQPLLGAVRQQQDWVLERMEALGFALQAETTWQNLTLDVLKLSGIVGEILPPDPVRSSLVLLQNAADVANMLFIRRISCGEMLPLVPLVAN